MVSTVKEGFEDTSNPAIIGFAIVATHAEPQTQVEGKGGDGAGAGPNGRECAGHEGYWHDGFVGKSELQAGLPSSVDPSRISASIRGVANWAPLFSAFPSVAPVPSRKSSRRAAVVVCTSTCYS